LYVKTSAVAWERVSVVGHSFTCRLRDFVKDKSAPFGLSKCEVRFFAKGGLHVHELLDLCQPLSQFRPQLIIIMAGDNDLGPGVEPQEIACQLVEVARSHQRQYGAYRVIIRQLMPRFWRSEYRYFFEGYNTLAAEVNQRVQAAVAEVEGLWFWYHKFVLCDGDITAFSPLKRVFEQDGVHLAANGLCLLVRSWGRAVRQCRVFE
jgi:lysophospholipase L1-like esterase